MKALITIILSVFIAATANAQHKIKAHIILVKGPDAIPLEFIAPVWDAAREHLFRAGISMSATRFSVIADPYPHQQTLKSRASKARNMHMLARRKKWFRKVDLVHVIVPPMQENGVNWFAGQADYICTSGDAAFSISNGGYGTTGIFQYRKSAVAMAHEIAHTLGAKHNNEIELMNSSALGFTDQFWPLPVLDVTKKGIDRCQRRRKAGKKAARKAVSFS